ncbi:hypothetical protein [Caballeronia sp. LZ035]|uniref:hypothetical protein n=1 Tax=Caballeronia sp. LZ035 TaxID=3038568 RepID=UPI0028679F42|nr:hypothetical protein [Caballeronia sp. LZ035]MDR5757389.1 hypothetical protein [Caballeronia sp. LZ035]
MKASTLLAPGALVALMSTTAMSQAQPPPAASDFHVSTRAAMEAPQGGPRTRGVTPPAPRGDLRGDIASNVRARPDSERDGRPQHH